MEIPDKFYRQSDPTPPKQPLRIFGDHPNSFAITWLFYAFVIFWPFIFFHGVALVIVQTSWIVFILAVLIVRHIVLTIRDGAWTKLSM
jgi:hypothetical protein